MIATFLAGIGGKILMVVLAGGLIVGGYFYWQHIVTSRALIAAQRDQLAEAIRVKDATIAERNRIWKEVLDLDGGRVRLCAVRGPDSGCCKPEPAECVP